MQNHGVICPWNVIVSDYKYHLVPYHFSFRISEVTVVDCFPYLDLHAEFCLHGICHRAPYVGEGSERSLYYGRGFFSTSACCSHAEG